MPDDPLSLLPDEIRAFAQAAGERVAAYYGGLRDRPVLVPTTSESLRALIDEPLPLAGAPFESLLDELDAKVFRYSRHNAHPRMFGYVASPGTPVTAIGSMVESALNVNVTAWRSGPAAAELERTAINWLKEILGFPKDSIGLFVSGGSMANFAGLAAARSAKAPVNVVRDGLHAAGAMIVYVSEEAHFSVEKAAAMLGLGEANVRHVRTDDRFRLDLAHLEALVAADRAAGLLPFCVVASAGTTATGAIDPIAAIADFAQRNGLWLHVDAAYGGPAALVPEVRARFAGIERADSIALDPHKWLYLPMGCGCVLYRDPAAARAAFAHGAEYTRTIGLEHDEAFAFWDYGPELSRPFRALELWFLMKFAGAKRLSEAIAENIACAKYFETLIQSSDDFEMLAPVELSIFCFRYKNGKGDPNALNERLLIALQKAGSSYLSNANLRGQFALRGCVLNYRTTKEDMARLLEDVREAARLIADS
jgi:glutamate/tyrosine decarboxylase-like PLP-dependent enzyme